MLAASSCPPLPQITKYGEGQPKGIYSTNYRNLVCTLKMMLLEVACSRFQNSAQIIKNREIFKHAVVLSVSLLFLGTIGAPI